MRLGQKQRTHFQSRTKDGGRPPLWREAAVVATLLIGAGAANWAQPAEHAVATSSASGMQRADIIDDIIDVIEEILGGGSGSGSGSGSGTGSGGSGGGSGNP
jgi:hypothetical protein